jgi:hypothetical protein
MSKPRKVAKKRVKRHSRHGGTKVLPAHMLGKSLTKKVGKKTARRKRA